MCDSLTQLKASKHFHQRALPPRHDAWGGRARSPKRCASLPQSAGRASRITNVIWARVGQARSPTRFASPLQDVGRVSTPTNAICLPATKQGEGEQDREETDDRVSTHLRRNEQGYIIRIDDTPSEFQARKIIPEERPRTQRRI